MKLTAVLAFMAINPGKTLFNTLMSHVQPISTVNPSSTANIPVAETQREVIGCLFPLINVSIFETWEFI
jgi:hypothetical protein